MFGGAAWHFFVSLRGDELITRSELFLFVRENLCMISDVFIIFNDYIFGGCNPF